MNARDWPERYVAPIGEPTTDKGESWRIAN